nr:uncharacterized protein LOC128675711 [Plodia interpunctella]
MTIDVPTRLLIFINSVQMVFILMLLLPVVDIVQLSKILDTYKEIVLSNSIFWVFAAIYGSFITFYGLIGPTRTINHMNYVKSTAKLHELSDLMSDYDLVDITCGISNENEPGTILIDDNYSLLEESDGERHDNFRWPSVIRLNIKEQHKIRQFFKFTPKKHTECSPSKKSLVGRILEKTKSKRDLSSLSKTALKENNNKKADKADKDEKRNLKREKIDAIGNKDLKLDKKDTKDVDKYLKED